MAAAIPRLVRLLEETPGLKFIHPFTEYSYMLCRYRTSQGKLALKVGALESEVYENDYASSLEPGALHVTNYFIGLEVDVDAGKRFTFSIYSLTRHGDAYSAYD